MNYITGNIDLYRKKNEQYGLGAPQNLWRRKESQVRRFEQFTKIFDFRNKSILDVGCGYGDFYTWLLNQGVKPKAYIGIDLMPEHCKIARDQLPKECTIIEGDFLKMDISEVDLSILSGTLNAEFEGWIEITHGILDKMWALSSEGMAFNMQSSHGIQGEYKEKVLKARNIDPGYWSQYAHNKTCRYGLYHDYMHYDYTVALWKAEAAWQEKQ